MRKVDSKHLNTLIKELKSAKNEAQANKIKDQIITFLLSHETVTSQQLNGLPVNIMSVR